jgi:hypothetical protein
MYNDKLKALKEANTIISRKLKSLDYSLNDASTYESETLFQSSNSETSLNVLSIVGGQKSNVFVEKEFQRIVCLEGEVLIHLIGATYNEKIKMSSSNTVLIPPQTKYMIETLKDSEIIVVFKPKKEEKEKILVGNTIYTKKEDYE